VKTRKIVFFDRFGDIEDTHAWFGNDGWAYGKARKRFAGGSCEKCPCIKTGQEEQGKHTIGITWNALKFESGLSIGC
jgi:hypothetical protein